MRVEFKDGERPVGRQMLVTSACVLLALAARIILDQHLGNQLPFAFFLGAVVISAWYGRLPQSVLAAMAGYLMAGFFIEPEHVFTLRNNFAGRAAFVMNSAIVIILSELMHHARSRARRLADELQIVLSSINDAVVVTDNQCKIVYLNKMAEQMTGRKTSEVKGTPLTDILQFSNDRRGTTEGEIKPVVKENELPSNSEPVILLSRQRQVIQIHKSVSPLKDESGAVRGMVLVLCRTINKV